MDKVTRVKAILSVQSKILARVSNEENATESPPSIVPSIKERSTDTPANRDARSLPRR